MRGQIRNIFRGRPQALNMVGSQLCVLDSGRAGNQRSGSFRLVQGIGRSRLKYLIKLHIYK